MGIAFIIDEFGKFLEYAAKNNPEVELYFIQQLCEWINTTGIQAVLMGTLHQDFSSYSFGLNKNQQQEWSKVKGRFKEVLFNEPVEQLLFLASEKINESFKHLKTDSNFDKVFKEIRISKAFPLRDYFLTAAILTLSLQRYGQNERSLFSFIESNDHLSLNSFDSNKLSYYSIDKVYDYLINNYYSVITQKGAKADFLLWSTIRRALEKIEGVIDESMQLDAQRLIKTIGLLNIFSSSAAQLGEAFYISYGKYSLGIKNPKAVLEELEKFKIIRYVKHSFRYIIFEGTDLDIDLAIDEAGKIIEKTSNVVEHLNNYFDFPFIAAKSIFYEKGTPRFFQFKLSEEPMVITPEGEIDGFINLIFNQDNKVTKAIKKSSSDCEEAILYGYYKNSQEIQNTLFEIQKVKKVISSNLDDKVAIRELNGIKEHHTRLLNHYVLDSLYSDKEIIEWYYNGAKIKITHRQSFNKKLSTICDEIYEYCPILKNELLNKTKTSSQISTARKELIKKLLYNLHEENLGLPTDKFPPEKSIYLSLLQAKGLHAKVNGIFSWQKPTDASFEQLWKIGETFLESTKGNQRNLQEYIDMLLSKPFKLKQGFIDFWVPIFLLSKADEYALFDNNGYIPLLNEDILEIINKKPEMFKLKAFDVAGIKLELLNRYRIFLSQPENSKPNNKVFIQTIKPFLNFYRDLKDYAKQTKNLNKRTLAVRDAIANAKDPEKTFFEDFPIALGYSLHELQLQKGLAESFIKKLQESIKEITSSYDRLLTRFENCITKDVLGTNKQFPDYKELINNRYKKLKVHLLSTAHKSFYARLISPLDDRGAWLNSISQACIGKALDKLSDEDEIILFEKFADSIYALDNYVEFSKVNIHEDEEDVVKFEMTSFVEGLSKTLLRIPKSKTKEIEDKQIEIKSILGKDKKTNVVVLAHLIKEYLTNE